MKNKFPIILILILIILIYIILNKNEENNINKINSSNNELPLQIIEGTNNNIFIVTADGFLCKFLENDNKIEDIIKPHGKVNNLQFIADMKKDQYFFLNDQIHFINNDKINTIKIPDDIEKSDSLSIIYFEDTCLFILVNYESQKIYYWNQNAVDANEKITLQEYDDKSSLLGIGQKKIILEIQNLISDGKFDETKFSPDGSFWIQNESSEIIQIINHKTINKKNIGSGIINKEYKFSAEKNILMIKITTKNKEYISFWDLEKGDHISIIPIRKRYFLNYYDINRSGNKAVLLYQNNHHFVLEVWDVNKGVILDNKFISNYNGLAASSFAEDNIILYDIYEHYLYYKK